MRLQFFLSVLLRAHEWMAAICLTVCLLPIYFSSFQINIQFSYSVLELIMILKDSQCLIFEGRC